MDKITPFIPQTSNNFGLDRNFESYLGNEDFNAWAQNEYDIGLDGFDALSSDQKNMLADKWDAEQAQGTSFKDGAGIALGAGQLGLGVMGYLDNKKTASKQRALLGQQIESNRYALDTAKQRQTDISNAFGTQPVR